MARTIQQAEAELRTAALEWEAANSGYYKACSTEPEFFATDAKGERTWTSEKATPAWTAAWRASFDADNALHLACRALADAIAAEHHAEAL